MEELTVRLPKQMLLDILRQISGKELEALIREIAGKSQLEPVWVS